MKDRNNPLEYEIFDIRKPRGVTDAQAVEVFLAAARSSSKVLPPGYSAKVRWRNPATREFNSRGEPNASHNWQERDLTEACQKSSAGFSSAIGEGWRERLADLRIERLPKKPKPRREFMKRSRAARKGWETRWRSGKAVGAKGQRFLERESAKRKPARRKPAAARKPAKKRKGTKKR